MTALRVVIGIAILLIMHHSTASGSQRWTEGTVIDQSLTGFKEYPFTIGLDALQSRGFQCGELYPTSDAFKCEYSRETKETFLGQPAELTAHLTKTQDLGAFVITTKLSFLRVEQALEESLGPPFSIKYEVPPLDKGRSKEWIEKVWVFENGALLDLVYNGSYIEFLRYISPERASSYRKGLLLQFPYLHKFLPPIDKNDL